MDDPLRVLDVEQAITHRCTGKEKDEETGLGYHEARYYACWLGRWTSADPDGLADGPNQYTYTPQSPLRFHDSNGRGATDQVDTTKQLALLPEGTMGERARKASAIAFQVAINDPIHSIGNLVLHPVSSIISFAESTPIGILLTGEGSTSTRLAEGGRSIASQMLAPQKLLVDALTLTPSAVNTLSIVVFGETWTWKEVATNNTPLHKITGMASPLTLTESAIGTAQKAKAEAVVGTALLFGGVFNRSWLMKGFAEGEGATFAGKGFFRKLMDTAIAENPHRSIPNRQWARVQERMAEGLSQAEAVNEVVGAASVFNPTAIASNLSSGASPGIRWAAGTWQGRSSLYLGGALYFSLAADVLADEANEIQLTCEGDYAWPRDAAR